MLVERVILKSTQAWRGRVGEALISASQGRFMSLGHVSTPISLLQQMMIPRKLEIPISGHFLRPTTGRYAGIKKLYLFQLVN